MRHDPNIILIGEIRDKDSAELAMKLANPVASLISVPLQLNLDEDIEEVVSTVANQQP